MSSSRAGPVLSRTGVRSMITVTYLSPRRVCRHTCSSTPITLTPSKRSGSSIRTRWPSASTALLAVFHDTARPSATRATLRCWHTRASSAHRRARRDSLARGSAAFAAVLAPHMTAAGASVAAHGDQQGRGPPPERFVRKLPGHGVAQGTFLAAASTPAILVGDPACQHRPVGLAGVAQSPPARAHRGGRTWSGQGRRR